MGACQSTNKNVKANTNNNNKNPMDESESKISKTTKLENEKEKLESKQKTEQSAQIDPLKNMPSHPQKEEEKELNLPDARNTKIDAGEKLEEPIAVLNGKSEVDLKKENSENKEANEAEAKADKIEEDIGGNNDAEEEDANKPEGNEEESKQSEISRKISNAEVNGNVENVNTQVVGEVEGDNNPVEETPQNNQEPEITQNNQEAEITQNNQDPEITQNNLDENHKEDSPVKNVNLEESKQSVKENDDVSNSNFNGRGLVKKNTLHDNKDFFAEYKPVHLGQGVETVLHIGDNQFDSLERENGVAINETNNKLKNDPFTFLGKEIIIQDDESDNRSALEESQVYALDVNKLKLSNIYNDEEITKYESSDVRGGDALRMNVNGKSRGINSKPSIPDGRRLWESAKSKNTPENKSNILTEADLAIFDLFLNPNRHPLDPNFEMKKLIINELSLDHLSTTIKSSSNSLIYQLIPFIVDNFRRRLDLKGIKEIFSKFNKVNKGSVKISNLNQRNIIELLLHVINSESKVSISHMLQNFNYYLPLTYWKFDLEKRICDYHIEFPLINDMVNMEKSFILNIGLTNGIGKTEILSDLFNIDRNNLNISNMSGILREGTFDMYNRNDLSVFDLNQLSLKECVVKVLKEIMKISSVVLIHLDYMTLKREVKSDKFKSLESLLDPKKKLIFFIRNFDEDETDVIDKMYIQKLFKNKIEIMEIIKIKNLAEINSEEKETEITELREKFKTILPKILEEKKIFNAFSFEDSLTDSVNNIYKDYEYVENIFANLEKTENSQTSPFSKLLKFSYEKYKIEKLEKEKLPTNHSALKKIDITQTFLNVFIELLVKNEKNKLVALDSHLEKMSEIYLRPLIQRRNKLIEGLIGMSFMKIKNLADEDISQENVNNQLQSHSSDIQKEISNLNEEIENNNITFDHFYSEIFNFYDFYHSMEYEKENHDYLFENLKKAYIREVMDGYPIHIIRNNLISIHHEFLEEIFGDENFRNKKYFVVSILGMQSSAKSTLLNYLFGTSFKVSSGRCTRGIYASIIQTENRKENIILLDTEGLSSIEGHDKLFDHQMALMCFGLSHLVLINHKGELSKNLQELLEISLYAMNYMSILNKSNPKIFFVLRDQIEREGDKHNAALAKAKMQLQDIANKQNINLEDVMKIDLENLILLPSAFKENTENGINIISPSNTFSKEVLKLRKKIFGEFENIKSANKLTHLHNFYNHASNLWTSFNKYGIDLLSCDSLREYEQKLEINDEIKKLVETENKKLSKDINLYLETSYDSVKSLSKLIDDQYEIYITNVYNESIKWIIYEIEDIFKNKRQFPQKIIDEGFETIKDNMNLLKKHMLYFWKTKFVYLNRDIQTKQLQSEIKNRIEREIERIVEYCEEEKEVLDNLSNVTAQYKKKLIENIPLPVLEEIKKSCFQTFNYCAKFPFPKIKFSELEEMDKINKKNWVHFNFADNLTSVLSKSINPREIKDMDAEKLNVLIEFEEFMKNLFLNFEKTEVVSDDKVLFYTTQIENFLKTDNSKNGFDRFNKDILYKDLSLIFITKLSEIIYENQNKKYIKEINFITDNISNIYKESIDLFNTRKDNLQFTEKLAESYLISLFNNVRLLHSAQIISIVEKEFEDLPKDPEDFIRYAYEISFNRKNSRNVYKFVMDINKFLLEIFYDLVKNKKENIVHIFKDKFETDLINKRKKFEVLINSFQLENKRRGIEKFCLKDFNYAVNYSGEISDYIEVKNIYDKIEFNLNDFCQIFLSAVRNFYSDTSVSNSMLQNTFTEIETRMNNFLEDKKNLIIGCQHVCPFCNSKCIKPAGEHSNHQAIHVINGFGGCKCVDNNEAILEYCLSKANMERKWRNPRDPTQFHKGIVEVCEFHFPDWVEDFLTNSKILSRDEEDKQMHCWYYVRKPICTYYGMKDHTNPNYLLDPNNILPEDFGQNY
jgi:hypothetical protein